MVEAVINTKNIDHRAVKAIDCPCGESKLKGEFPDNVRGYIQYGDSFTAISGLLSTFGAVSTDRIQNIIDGMFNVTLSEGTICSMIDRLIKLKASVCLFIHNFAVPFDNNQAERDVSNVKTKSKVSGCFRSIKGAQTYLTITSFLSTARKQGIDAFEALTSAFNGKAEITFVCRF